MDSTKKRAAFIDYAKGFAIVLLIFSHTMANEYGIKTWICSFHMPIFFIICGLLTQIRFGMECIRMRDVKALLLRRLRQLGIPYLVFCFLLMLFYCGLGYASHHEFPWRGYLFRILTLQGIDSLWFIPCYFAAELLLYLSLSSPQSRNLTTGFAAVAIIVLCIYRGTMPSYWLYRLLLKILICYIFVYIGYWIGTAALIKQLPVWCGIILLGMGIPLSLANGFSAIGSLELNHRVLFFFNAAATSAAVLALFYRMEKAKTQCRILSFYGKDSIVILCTNNLLIEIIRLLDYKIAGGVFLSAGMMGCILFTLLLLALEAGLIQLSHGKPGPLFGRTLSK